MRGASRLLVAYLLVSAAVAHVACTAPTTERVASQSASIDAVDGGSEAGANGARLDEAAAALNANDAATVEQEEAIETLQRHELAAVLVDVTSHTRVTSDILGKEIQGSGKATVLGPITVKIEGQGEYRVEKRLVLKVAQRRYIVAGHPDTVRAALKALKQACLAEIRAKALPMPGMSWDAPTDDSVPTEPAAPQCCEVVELSGMTEEEGS